MYRPSCHICQRQLPLSKSLLIINDRCFCKEHLHLYKIRQQDGVITNKLDAQWLDTLDNWRDRPIELDHEIGKKPFSSLLFFHERYDDWLIFMRSYIVRNGHKTMIGVVASTVLKSLRRNKQTATIKLKKGRKMQTRPQFRMADALVTNTQTGEIRRFVDVLEDTVIDDLQGIRAAPYQAEIAHLWGNSDPTGIQERFNQQYHDENHRILIPALIHLCSFPVYGLIEHPLELSPGYGLGYSGGVWQGISDISFCFSSPRYPQTHNNLELCSSDARKRHILYNQDHAIESLFRGYSHEKPGHYGPEERAQFGSPSLWEGEITIADTTFSGTIHHWSQPEQITMFRLKSEKTIISGHSFGRPYDDLLQVLKATQPINEREEILAAYQRDLDAELMRLRAQFAYE